MEKQLADKTIMELTKPIYGFALSKTNDSYAAEDLAGRIILEVYESLIRKDDIRDCRAYSMVIAMNIWKRFINEKINSPRMIPIDYVNLYSLKETADTLIINKEEKERLRREIAFLSNHQRQIIVLYYFKSMSIRNISLTLNIPEGTVKWHLFEARKELKMGIKKQMEVGVQGLNPVKFTNMGHSGYVGTSGNTDDILSTLLSQNIIWLCYKQKQSRDEIAKELGVNPLFIEDEIQRLVEIGFLETSGSYYMSDMWIYEPTREKEQRYSEVYMKYAELVVDSFFINFIDLGNVALKNNGMLVADANPDSFIWSAVLYSFNKLYFNDLEKVSYDKLVKYRSDGGKYIAFSTIDNGLDSVEGQESIYRVCGDMWRGDDKIRGWQFDTYWSGRDYNWREVKTSDFLGLYTLIESETPLSEENADLIKRLMDKKMIFKKDGKYVPTINIIKATDPESELKKLYPPVENNLLKICRRMDIEINEIIASDSPAINKDYASFFSQNSLSSPMFRPYVIKELLKRGILKELPDNLKGGIGVFIFVKE